MKKERIKTTWRPATYDVWGNHVEGYDVNDVYRQPEVELNLIAETNNKGMPQEFKSAYPSLAQIRDVFGVRCHLQLDGDDIYVNRRRDGYPIGELVCTSHKSLSPITPLTQPTE